LEKVAISQRVLVITLVNNVVKKTHYSHYLPLSGTYTSTAKIARGRSGVSD
jgi:hypothetical protein